MALQVWLLLSALTDCLPRPNVLSPLGNKLDHCMKVLIEGRKALCVPLIDLLKARLH